MIFTGDALLDMIQTAPSGVASHASAEESTRPATGGGIRWEGINQASHRRLIDIKDHLKEMKAQAATGAAEARRQSRSRSPAASTAATGTVASTSATGAAARTAATGAAASTTATGDGGLFDDIADKVRFELNKLRRHPRVVIKHFVPQILNFKCERNYVILMDHALTVVHHLVEEMEPEPFYIGICCSAFRRWVGYRGIDMDYKGHRKDWEHMFLICAADGPTVARLEDDLLWKHNYLKHDRCKNKIRGGGRRGPANEMSFLYICREFYVE